LCEESDQSLRVEEKSSVRVGGRLHAALDGADRRQILRSDLIVEGEHRVPARQWSIVSVMQSKDTGKIALSAPLARRLRDVGLTWHPEPGDRFAIPDRGLDDRLFAISDMVIEVRDRIGDRELAFNGTVEWALDSILTNEVIWVPTEGQLRELIGEAFIALYRDDDRYACVVRVDGEPTTFVAPTAADAYGEALLATLGG
jgi:hypothetical protein